MVNVMPCNNLCNANPEWLRAVEEMVVETVLYFRNRGHNRDTAIEQGSLALGLSNRRVWSFFYQQPVAIAREEYEQIRSAFAAHLDHQAEDLARRSEAARLRRRQLTLDIL